MHIGPAAARVAGLDIALGIGQAAVPGTPEHLGSLVVQSWAAFQAAQDNTHQVVSVHW